MQGSMRKILRLALCAPVGCVLAWLIFAVRYTPGGYTLAQDVDNHEVSGLLGEARWDFVVLQENSNYSQLDDPYRESYTLAPARLLAGKIRASGARPLVFMTWGYRGGYPDMPGDTYESMQDRVDGMYRELAGEIAAPLAPVGLAWSTAVREDPSIDLWLADGVHPSVRDSYLAACVFYALLYHRDPSSSYTAGLGRADAVFLQGVARSVVDGLPALG
jgi:hypothetical protein